MIWESTKLLPEKWLNTLNFAQKINRFFGPNSGDLQKKRVLSDFEMVFLSK